MLEQLLSLQREDKWLEMRALIPAVFDGLGGKDLMKAYALASHAYANTATNSDDWELARVYAAECQRRADKGSPTYLWALVQLSVIYSNTGRIAKAETYAQAFLQGARSVPAVSHLRPWALGACGFAYYLNRNFRRAAFYFGNAAFGFQQNGNDYEYIRVRTKSAWAFARAGLSDKAWAALPETTIGDTAALWHGARTLLLAKERRWSDALAEGRLALSSPRHAADNIDLAEVLSVMAECMAHSGENSQQVRLMAEARDAASRQARDANAIIALNLRESGGDTPYDTETRGSANPRDCATFTSGVG